MTDTNASSKSSTIATKIGLTVPIKEKTIKSYVNHLASTDSSKLIPKQVPKISIVAVSAGVEYLLGHIVDVGMKGVEGATFTVDNLRDNIKADDDLCFLTTGLKDAMEYVNAQKEIKRAKKNRGKESTTAAPTEQQTQDMPDAEAPGDNEEGSETDHPHSFSCLNQINKRIKLASSNIRVSSEAVDLIQYLLDEFYQGIVSGAYWIAQNNGRKTLSSNDVSVALKIYLPKRLLPGLYAHVEALTKKFKDVEAAKPRNNAPASEPAAKKAKAEASKAATSEHAVKVVKPKPEAKKKAAKVKV
jgi:histone H3/H4